MHAWCFWTVIFHCIPTDKSWNNMLLMKQCGFLRFQCFWTILYLFFEHFIHLSVHFDHTSLQRLSGSLPPPHNLPNFLSSFLLVVVANKPLSPVSAAFICMGVGLFTGAQATYHWAVVPREKRLSLLSNHQLPIAPQTRLWLGASPHSLWNSNWLDLVHVSCG